jgi:hypothetical protein
MTASPNPRPDGRFTKALELLTMRELTDELVSRIGAQEVCRRIGLSERTADELQQWADELDRERA